MKPAFAVTVVPLHPQPPPPPSPTVPPEVLQVPCPAEQQYPTPFKDPDALHAQYQSCIEWPRTSLLNEIMNYAFSQPTTTEKTKILDLFLADCVNNPVYTTSEPPPTFLDADMFSAPLPVVPSDFDLDVDAFFASLSQSTGDLLVDPPIPNPPASAPAGLQWGGSFGPLNPLSGLTPSPSLASTLAGSSSSFQCLPSEFSYSILEDPPAAPMSTTESQPPPPLRLVTQGLGEAMIQDDAESPSTSLQPTTQVSEDKVVQDPAAPPLSPSTPLPPSDELEA